MDKPTFWAPGSPLSPDRGPAGAFAWSYAPSPAGCGGMMAGLGSIPLFQPSPRRQGGSLASPTHPFSPGALGDLFKSPQGAARTLPDAMRLDTPISRRLASGLFSPSPGPRSRLCAGDQLGGQHGLQQLQWDALQMPPPPPGGDHGGDHGAENALADIREMLAYPAKVGGQI